MRVLDLPNELLSTCLALGASAQPTRQKRRQQLLLYARVCKHFSVLCLKHLYSKVAYEISPRGQKLLDALGNNTVCAGFVRALAVREREGGVQRALINSRAVPANASSPSTRRNTKRSALDAVRAEEGHLTRLVRTLAAGKSLVELKWETNLLPSDDTSLAELAPALQTLFVVPQAPYPEAGDRESRLEAAQFTLTLPTNVFLPAFTAFDRLTYLDLWKCNFSEFGETSITDKPSFRLVTLVLQECTVSGQVLDWLTAVTVEYKSLRTLRLAFLSDDAGGKGERILKPNVLKLITKTAPHLDHFAFEGDTGQLDERADNLEDAADNEAVEGEAALLPSSLGHFRRLSSLRLGGEAITSRHWTSLPRHALPSLSTLEVHYAPSLPPEDVLESLRWLPPAETKLASVSLQGREDQRRRNIRELLATAPDQPGIRGDWTWSATEYAAFLSLADARGFTFTADGPVTTQTGGEGDSEGDESDGDWDDTEDFQVTAEQVGPLRSA